jgi:hypothetical protein
MNAIEALRHREHARWARQDVRARAKHADVARACGPGPFAAALELGGAIGELTALVAPRCRLIQTLDASPTGAALTRRRLTAVAGSRVRVVQGVIPRDLPPGPFDLVILADVLDTLAPADLRATLDALRVRTRPRARVVAVHPDRALDGHPLSTGLIHRWLRAQPWLIALEHHDRAGYVLDVLERR